MTFEDVFAEICKQQNIRLYGNYAEDIIDNCRTCYEAGAASRDAEVELANSIFAKQLIEADQLREQVTLLREALAYERSLYRVAGSDMDELGLRALASTEPKE